VKDTGWPNVVLNAISAETERNDIRGPFSLFVNLAGRSHIRTEGQNFSVHTDRYCITNNGQYYDLTIPKTSRTTTFNIHFGERFFEETVYSLMHDDSALLDQPESAGHTRFETYPRTVWKDKQFQSRIDRLERFYKIRSPISSPAYEDELLFDLLEYVLRFDSNELKAVHSLPASKPSTRRELMKRVFKAIEYIHDRFASEITLDDLSEVSNLSKFHLQRTFRQVKGITPQQYVARLRLLKAQELIENTEMPLGQIAVEAGFSEQAAFSRFFQHQLRITPSGYREKISKAG
jgi:AraC family transcriptional regulator